jgi:hypothetical protein
VRSSLPDWALRRVRDGFLIILHLRRKPKLPENEYHLTLTFRLPPSSRSAETAPWISLACNIADVLYSKQKLVPETAINKLVRRVTTPLSHAL